MATISEISRAYHPGYDVKLATLNRNIGTYNKERAMMLERNTISREPKSVKDFLEMAEQGFFKANPDANDAIIEWEFAERVTFPTGLEGYSGVAKAKCPGYRDKTIVASWTKHGLHVH